MPKPAAGGILNLLSAVMPGIREVRTPVAVGSLWLLFAYLAVAPNAAQIVAGNDVIASLSASVGSLPTAYTVGALAFIAYLLGAAVLPVSEGVAQCVLKPLAREREGRAKFNSYRGRFQRYLRRTIDVSEYRTPLMDAVNRVYVEQGVSANLALHYPVESIIGRLDDTALQLWHKAPAQYQEYDRLRAESGFRVGVACPLFAIGVVLAVILGFGFAWWVVPIAAVAAIVLIVQSSAIDHRRTVLIANALYQGIAEDIHSKSVALELKKVKFPRKGDSPASLLCAATAVAMHRIGDFEGANSMVWEAATEVGSYVEGAETGDEAADREVAVRAAVRKLLEDNDASEYVWVFDRRLEKLAEQEATATAAAD